MQILSMVRRISLVLLWTLFVLSTLSINNVCAQEPSNPAPEGSTLPDQKADETSATPPESTSQSNKEENKGRKILQAIAFTEGIIIFNSSLATLNPQAVGWFEAIVFPIGFASGSAEDIKRKGYWATQIVALGGFEALAIYNITELNNKERGHRNEVFIKNFIGHHIVIAATAATGYLTGYGKKSDLSFNYVPIHDGALLLASYKF